ncbi:hypothetical protein HF1_08350 [Mycoplasma haemofelis str. Langford 1]|uniref:Uncharacterized protein n=2 Tax=Mycoplasma haemofelis TaxID=29501 RepID=F6FIX4_MYCHI|nr:hypothetical protein [Mycoplasma haemofelis]AEG73172.1 hypothetical protein MHF_0915 [Mycoplasma haemofelis Ohio2]CBY92843.1 hypothetical protein HF1_08350 [Mycoplasma haemofelis str. Langford 1]
MNKLTLAYSAAGVTAASGAGVGGYMYATREVNSKEPKKQLISEFLVSAGKTVLSTEEGGTNKDAGEWTKRQTAYGSAAQEDLITDLDNSNPETTIAKSSTVDLVKMRKWCKKNLSAEFSSTEDALYKKVLKWCTKEAQ